MGLGRWGPHPGFSWHGPPRDPRLLAGAGVAGSGEPPPSSPEGPRPLTAGPGLPVPLNRLWGWAPGRGRAVGPLVGVACGSAPRLTEASRPPRPQRLALPWLPPGSRCHLPSRPQGVTWRALGPYAAATRHPGRPWRPLLPGLLTVPASCQRVCQSPFRRGGLSLLCSGNKVAVLQHRVAGT